MTRTLSLKREALVQLTDDDLARLAGGSEAKTLALGTCPLTVCVNDLSYRLSCSGCASAAGC